jgi:hypothetical protein
MKQLTKDTGGQLKPKASQGNSEIQSMSLTASTSGAPKKKPVFKAIGSSSSSAAVPNTATTLAGALDVNDPATATEENDPSGAVRNGYVWVLGLFGDLWVWLTFVVCCRWYADRYEPEFITGCAADCEACGGDESQIAI